MANYKLIISYDGSNFKGWQTQPKDRTVQATIENVIKDIFNTQDIKLIGSGRTDSGVHANNQVANFNFSTNMNENQIRNALNSKLPQDIFVKNCIEVDESFHSRFSALEREYKFYIVSEYNPTNRFYTWLITYDFDYDALIECSKLILGEHDFSFFSKMSSKVENKKCNIFKSAWQAQNGIYIYKIKGNRFLHHMVRFLVGTMFEVARGRFTVENFKDMLDCRQTNCYPVCAPATGLFLERVAYE